MWFGYYALLVVVVLAVLEALYSLKLGWEFLRFMRRSAGLELPGFQPPVTLIIPCRGVDPGLKENLSAFFDQKYPDFQIVVVTGDFEDPCVPHVNAVIQEFPNVTSHLVFAGRASACSQKVHNMLCALDLLRAEDEVVAFGDSDIRPGRDWLRWLVGSSESESVGMTTGFRWYLPQRGGLASLLRSVWNAGAVSIFREQGALFAWGGAMAIRRSTFEACDVREAWRNALSDDLAISRVLRQSGLTIRFVPQCLSFSHEDCSWSELLEWTFRQLLITRIYHPALWKMALISQSINATAIWVGCLSALVRWGWFSGQGSILLASLAAVVYLLGCTKAWLRLRALLVLFPGHEEILFRHRFGYLFLGPLASLISVLGLARSAFTRTIRWRGIRYRMVSPVQTEVLD